VKCIDDTSGIAVDICINNVLGVYNSRLLFTYAAFDTRIHALVRQ
jgi:DNA polymerase sigma